MDAVRSADPRHRIAPHLDPRARRPAAARRHPLRARAQGRRPDAAERGGDPGAEEPSRAAIISLGEPSFSGRGINLGHFVWNGDPEIVQFGPLALRWYGLLFASGLLCGYLLLLRIYRREKRSEANLSNLFPYVFFGTVIGARLGNILLYEPQYYFTHPWEIPAIW